MIALVDYGAGNLASVGKALCAIGADFVITNSPRMVGDADAVIVPGVGHFGATRAIQGALREALLESAATKPLLGICLGLQFLFEGSDEAPDAPGLALIPGRCRALPPTRKVPHVGWNTVETRAPSAILAGIPDETAFYFTHSFAAPVTSACVGCTRYTSTFAAAVEQGRTCGVQFHPEKSGEAGLRVLRNFVDAV